MTLFLRGWRLASQFRKGFKDLRYFSSQSNSSTDRSSRVVLSDNGQVIVCWHPEEFPPYEHTKPLPVLAEEFNEEDSVLKLQFRRDAQHRFQPDGPDIKELAKITYTSKHRWYQWNTDNYSDIFPPPKDRDGI